MSQNRSRQMKRQTRAPPKPKRNIVIIPGVHRHEEESFQYFMFTYKIGAARRKLTYHMGVYNYGTEKCPDAFNSGRRCPRGRKCKFAHGTMEVLFHPLVYKTRLCNKSSCAQGKDCAWAHSVDELRDRRRILKSNWRLSDPIIAWRTAKASQNSRRRGVRLDISPSDESSSCGASSSVGSAMVPPSRTWTQFSNASSDMSLATSAMPNGGQEADVEDDVVDMVEASPTAPTTSTASAEKGTEFEQWFWSVYDRDDAEVPYVSYLKRLESSNFDDLSFLFELFCDDDKLLDDVLVNEIGWRDDKSRGAFGTALWRYMCPTDVREWMVRVVKLAQYEDLFGQYETVDVLSGVGFDTDDLTEMGVSSAGHRTKILYHVQKMRLELGVEDNMEM